MNFSRPSSNVFWIFWHCLAIICIVLVPSQFQFGPVWHLPAREITFFAGLAISYLAIVIALTLKTRRQNRLRLVDFVSVYSVAFAGFFFFLLLLNDDSYSRRLLLICLALAGAFSVLSVSFKRALQKPALAVSVATVVVTLLLGFRTSSNPPGSEFRIIDTTLYKVVATFHRNHFPRKEKHDGGGLAIFRDGYLLAEGDGALHFLKLTDRKLETRTLTYRVPLNSEDFVQAAKSRKDITSYDGFRVADILIQYLGNKFRLFASHHYWDRTKACATVRVSTIESDYASFLDGRAPLMWQTLYETQPCLPFKKLNGFSGHALGGRMVLLDAHRLLLSVGDHEFDGVNAPELVSQDDAGSYGKTILINLDTRATRIFTKGHRNPQGLYVGPSGTIWSTEHGPKGGDELNFIVDGANYGWPLVTFGTDYFFYRWPINAKQGQHEGFELPSFSWLPAIGISNLIAVETDLFKLWRHDLLVSSLINKSLWRVRTNGRTILFTEQIKLGERIRDIIEASDGRIILWTDERSIVFLEPVMEDDSKAMAAFDSRTRGEIAFARCRGCHQLGDGNAHGIGPDLNGIFQRRIASAQGYKYSGALKALSGTWTEKQLDGFLADPQNSVPGTSMQVEGLTDPTERALIMGYLKSIK